MDHLIDHADFKNSVIYRLLSIKSYFLSEITKSVVLYKY